MRKRGGGIRRELRIQQQKGKDRAANSERKASNQLRNLERRVKEGDKTVVETTQITQIRWRIEGQSS